MNNNRLSTNSNPLIMDANTKSELDVLIKSEPLISIDSFYEAILIKKEKWALVKGATAG